MPQNDTTMKSKTMKRTCALKRTGFTKKQQESKRKSLHKKAWKLMSLYVRKRDGRCVTCGSTSNLQAGHFFHGALDFDFQNISTQCSGCNKYKHGNLIKYAIYLQKKYGYDIVEELERKSNIVHKHTIEELEAIINNLNYLLKGE
jgi:5-methylcytosine-specific restriction endonuclease McrA